MTSNDNERDDDRHDDIDELLTLHEVAELLRVPDATGALVANPAHRAQQLQDRPSRPLLPRRGAPLDPGAGRRRWRRMTLLRAPTDRCGVSRRSGAALRRQASNSLVRTAAGLAKAGAIAAHALLVSPLRAATASHVETASLTRRSTPSASISLSR